MITGVIFLLLILAVFFVTASRAKQQISENPSQYFLASKKANDTDLSSSSIAYGFQVSTIYPFLFWGTSMFLFVPAVNTIFWGIGILLFYLCIHRVQKHLGGELSLHGVLGKIYGPKVQQIASLLTIIGFAGYIIAELWFGSRVLLSILPNQYWVYGAIVAFVLFIGAYLFKSGQLGSMRTDQVQLVVSYFGIFGVVIYMLYLILANNLQVDNIKITALWCFAFFVLFILVARKAKFLVLKGLTAKIINIILGAMLVAALVLALIITGSNPSDTIQFKLDLEGFGVAGLLSLIILPLTWQFVDLTNWQRLLSVIQDDSSGGKSPVKKGLLIYALESPFSWLLFILFGILITTSFPDMQFQDVLIDFPRQLIESNSYLEQSLGYVFIVSIISIMLSTVDSFIMGISFTYVYDFRKKTRNLLNEQQSISSDESMRIITSGRTFGLIVVLISVLLFVIFDQFAVGGGELFITLLLSFYSVSVSFFPLIFGILFLEQKCNHNWALASILLGASSGVFIGVYSTLAAPALSWYPIIICLSLSSIVYAIGTFKERMS